jgi:type I restriction enzyme R subunit
MAHLTESEIESAALSWFSGLGYQTLFGPDIAPDMPAAEREHYGQVVLEGRLRDALARLNPQVPADALEEAFRKFTRPDSPSLMGTTMPFIACWWKAFPLKSNGKTGLPATNRCG